MRTLVCVFHSNYLKLQHGGYKLFVPSIEEHVCMQNLFTHCPVHVDLSHFQMLVIAN